ncbi:hypothetical protein QTP88_010440 [Uroleucon formosanum]
MRSQNRNVLIFLDNAACHPKIELSNTKILMLPPNTTSITQPMDQGVIYTFKSYYRKFLLQSLLCKMDNCSSAHQLAKSISVLDAVNWIALACDNVKAECVQNCFHKAGFFSNEGTNTNGIDLPENALNDINEECVIANVDVEDFITFDRKLETHQTYDSAIFLEEEEKEVENDDNDDSEINDEPKIKDFKTAISYLEELQRWYGEVIKRFASALNYNCRRALVPRTLYVMTPNEEQQHCSEQTECESITLTQMTLKEKLELEIAKSKRTIDPITQKETDLIKIIKKEMNLFENGGTRGHHLELAFKYLMSIPPTSSAGVRIREAPGKIC